MQLTNNTSNNYENNEHCKQENHHRRSREVCRRKHLHRTTYARRTALWNMNMPLPIHSVRRSHRQSCNTFPLDGIHRRMGKRRTNHRSAGLCSRRRKTTCAIRRTMEIRLTPRRPLGKIRTRSLLKSKHSSLHPTPNRKIKTGK